MTRSRSSLLALVVLLLAAGLAAHPAGAATIRRTYLPPSAFATQYGDASFFEGFPGVLKGAGCAAAPVRVPDGATVTGFFVYLVDGDATVDGTATLYRKNTGSTAILTSMAEIVTDGSDGVVPWFDVTISSAVVDNDLYAYYVRVCMASGFHHLQQIFVDYSL
jgi:hypothetical protein